MTDYADVLSTALETFGREAGEARRRAAALGARLVDREAADGAARLASEGAARGLADAHLLSVFAARPALLDADERLTGGSGGPRGALREALAAALRDDLEMDVEALVAEGQDADTLPEACAKALDAADASVPYPLSGQARAAFASEAWDDPAVRAIGVHLAAHLERAGAAGTGNDLRAALDGRSLVVGQAPGPR